MRSAYVLGSKGMLGSMVLSYLSNKKGWLVNQYYRDCGMSLPSFLGKIDCSNNNFVFNCIGGIPQKVLSTEKLYEANLAVVAIIASQLSKDVRLIHPSSDCVFAGTKRDAYHKYDVDYSLDPYGLSKRAAEALLLQRPNTLIMRASIIGKGLHDKGLFSWILSNRCQQVLGYENHFWNGLTTLEWVKQAIYLIEENDRLGHQGLVQLGTEKSISKAELVKKVSDIFELNIDVVPVEKEFRSLVLESDYLVKPLDDQLKDFKNFLITK